MIWIHFSIAVIQILAFIYFKNQLAFWLIDKLDYTKLSKRDIISSDVMAIYVEALENPALFSQRYCTVGAKGSPILIWSANELVHRMFYTHDKSLEKQVERMNAKLTIYDKKLLDKLCNRVREGELHLINTFFDA